MKRLTPAVLASIFLFLGGPASARYYEASTGRFLQEDPILLPMPTFSGSQNMSDSQSLNLYTYVGNRPLYYTDPLGLRWEYSQRTGILWYVNDITGRRTYIGEGFAGGGEGLNNPALQNVPFTGPIPRGDWIIGPGYNSAHLGPLTMDLTTWWAETFGRNLFRIHGGTRSEGCMLMGPNIRQRVNRSGDRNLRVTW